MIIRLIFVIIYVKRLCTPMGRIGVELLKSSRSKYPPPFFFRYKLWLVLKTNLAENIFLHLFETHIDCTIQNHLCRIVQDCTINNYFCIHGNCIGHVCCYPVFSLSSNGGHFAASVWKSIWLTLVIPFLANCIFTFITGEEPKYVLAS